MHKIFAQEGNMTKALNSQQPINNDQDETKKRRKKQAKREAKLMLELEDARKDVQRAEQKFSKAQSNLEASRSHVHDLEEQLAQIRDQHTPLAEPAVATTPVGSAQELSQEQTSMPDQEEA